MIIGSLLRGWDHVLIWVSSVHKAETCVDTRKRRWWESWGAEMEAWGSEAENLAISLLLLLALCVIMEKLFSYPWV